MTLHTWYLVSYGRSDKAVCAVNSDRLSVYESCCGTQEKTNGSGHLRPIDTDEHTAL